MNKDTKEILMYGGIAVAAYLIFFNKKATTTPITYVPPVNTGTVPASSGTNVLSMLVNDISKIFSGNSSTTTGPDGSVLSAVDPGLDLGGGDSWATDPDNPDYLQQISLT